MYRCFTFHLKEMIGLKTYADDFCHNKSKTTAVGENGDKRKREYICYPR